MKILLNFRAFLEMTMNSKIREFENSCHICRSISLTSIDIINIIIKKSTPGVKLPQYIFNYYISLDEYNNMYLMKEKNRDKKRQAINIFSILEQLSFCLLCNF